MPESVGGVALQLAFSVCWLTLVLVTVAAALPPGAISSESGDTVVATGGVLAKSPA